MQAAVFHMRRGTLWYRRASTPLCSIVGSSSSVVEPSRWWTYAALMHAIITFISWRWHVTSSGPCALWGPERFVCFFFFFSLLRGSRLSMGGIVSNHKASACTHTHTRTHTHRLHLEPPPLSPPPSIKVNKGFQQRANEHGPLSRDACLCCLPPRTLLVYLGCQVKGRLREGETFFFFLIRPGLVSIETAGQHYRDDDKRAKSGLRASRSVPHCCWRHLCLRQRNERAI